MSMISEDSLRHLDGRVSSLLALRGRQDAEGLATSSAKRRFLRIELEVAGLNPDGITQTEVMAAEKAGCPALTQYLDSLRKLGVYAGSEARRKWNPNAQDTDKASQVPVASDWFLQSTVPANWDEMDFLGRCESIWLANNFTDAGMLFTRIFDHRVKMLAGYEDGLRLVLLLTEVGQYVQPIDIPQAARVQVEAVDLVRRKYAFDDRDPDDYRQPIAVPMGKPEWTFSLAEIYSRPFKNLQEVLGREAFEAIVDRMGYKYPEGEFETWVGDDHLALYYYVREDALPGSRLLLLVSAGEFQPGRVMAHLEGIWRVTGANL